MIVRYNVEGKIYKGGDSVWLYCPAVNKNYICTALKSMFDSYRLLVPNMCTYMQVI